MKILFRLIPIAMLVSFATLLSVLVPGEVCARTINVPADYSTIKEALFRASENDFIKIAPGRYFEANLEMRHTVTMVGMGDSPEEVIIDGYNQARILWCESMINPSIIQNISFVNGNASGEAIYDQSGGAILFSNCSPRIINCHFTDNVADASGGAIRCTNASPQIINCLFTNNTAGDGGGAIDCSYGSSPLINDCFFKNNIARWGGGLSCRGNASPIVYRGNFDRNIATGSNLGFGGAVFADYEAQPVFTECTFFANEARYGGAIACFEDSGTNLNHCTILENTAIWMGGGMFSKDASPTIQNTIFAFQAGSAITAAGTSIPNIEYSDLFGNTLGDWVGAIANQEGGTNLSVDPIFCEYDPNYFFNFTLSDDSPLSMRDADNGPIGAWPVGCATLDSGLDLEVRWLNKHPYITWNVDPNAAPMIFRLTRSMSSEGRLTIDIPFNIQGGENFVAVDSDIVPVDGQKFIYQLYILDPRENWVLLEEATLDSSVPQVLEMQIQVYPNPFNPFTNIHFEVERAQRIKLSIFDMRGNRIALLEDSIMESGSKTIPWHGRNDAGMRVSSGTYVIVVQGDSTTKTMKIMMLK